MGAKEVMSTADFETRKKAVYAGRLGETSAKELHIRRWSESHYTSSQKVAHEERYMYDIEPTHTSSFELQ